MRVLLLNYITNKCLLIFNVDYTATIIATSRYKIFQKPQVSVSKLHPTNTITKQLLVVVSYKNYIIKIQKKSPPKPLLLLLQ